MKHLLFGSIVLAGAFALVAAPRVTDVALTQDAATRRVTITYKLPTEAAVVTMDILTNGVSIGATHFADAFGDVGDVVQPTTGDDVRRIWWQPDVSWAFNRVTDGSLKVALTAWATNAPPDYIVYDLRAGNPTSRVFYVSADCIPGGVTNAIYKETKLVMRRIPAAGVRWRMGAPVGVIGRNKKNETAHYVTLTKDFYLAIYPFTQRQYKELTGSYMTTYTRNQTPYRTNSWWNADWRPTESQCAFNSVRGGDAVTAGSYLGKLRVRTGQDTFDLPTEAQWEFACRAGTTTPLYTGTESLTNHFCRIGWCKSTTDTGDSCVQPVGLKEPNAYGLYDMLGTVVELCLDWYQEDLGTAEAVDPTGPATGTKRVTRSNGVIEGFQWFSGDTWYVPDRASRRDSQDPAAGSLSIGFRPSCAAFVR